MKIINSGKTPALKFKGRITAQDLPKESQFYPDYRALPLGANETVGVILPNVSMILNTVPRGKKLEQEVVDGIKNGTIILYVYGELTYEDVSGRPHTTDFCVCSTCRCTTSNFEAKRVATWNRT